MRLKLEVWITTDCKEESSHILRIKRADQFLLISVPAVQLSNL